MVGIAVSHPVGPSSIPGQAYFVFFSYFKDFSKYLGPFLGLGRTWASKRPFSLKTRGPKEPLDTEFVHGLPRALGEIRLEIHDFSMENWL